MKQVGVLRWLSWTFPSAYNTSSYDTAAPRISEHFQKTESCKFCEGAKVVISIKLIQKKTARTTIVTKPNVHFVLSFFKYYIAGDNFIYKYYLELYFWKHSLKTYYRKTISSLRYLARTKTIVNSLKVLFIWWKYL